MRISAGILTLSLLAGALPVQAQIGDSPREITVFASTCERLINGESRSSARVRAADKASFKAVEEIPELRTFRDRLDTHNFNLKVYRLVDNYLEDLKITTTSQDAGRVCVEVGAYLPASAIDEVFAPEEDGDALALEVEDEITDDGGLAVVIPPKPDITINKAIAYETAAAAPVEPVRETSLPPVSASSPEPAAEIRDMPEIKEPKVDQVSVFIDKTEFYNGTSTGGFFAQLEKELLAKPGIRVIARSDKPDYVLKTKVLKAKVDNINSETSRLQIVVALELTDTSSSDTVTEHQNRFILFNSSEDAQQVAADLTRKLFAAGIGKLLPEIKTGRVGSIITPNRPHSPARPDEV